MSDDLVKRLGIIARAEMSNYAERTVNEAAAALVAKDAEIAQMRDAVRLFVKYDDTLDADGAQMMLAYNDAITAARSALNAHHKEGKL